MSQAPNEINDHESQEHVIDFNSHFPWPIEEGNSQEAFEKALQPWIADNNDLGSHEQPIPADEIFQALNSRLNGQIRDVPLDQDDIFSPSEPAVPESTSAVLNLGPHIISSGTTDDGMDVDIPETPVWSASNDSPLRSSSSSIQTASSSMFSSPESSMSRNSFTSHEGGDCSDSNLIPYIESQRVSKSASEPLAGSDSTFINYSADSVGAPRSSRKRERSQTLARTVACNACRRIKKKCEAASSKDKCAYCIKMKFDNCRDEEDKEPSDAQIPVKRRRNHRTEPLPGQSSFRLTG